MPLTAWAQTKGIPTFFAVQFGTTPPIQILRYEGGEPVAAVVTTASPSGLPLPNKSPGAIQYRDIVFDYQPVTGAAINTVIADVMAGNSPALSGAVLTMDGSKKELSRQSFANAFVRSIEFSDLDATITNQAPTVRITLALQLAQRSEGSNQVISFGMPTKGPLKSSFRLSIQQLEMSSQKSVRVEPLKFNVPIMVQSGPGGSHTIAPAGPGEYANLIAILPETDAGPFMTWQQQHISQPQTSGQLEKAGTLEWLSSDKTKTHVSLQLQNLGILSVIRLPNKPGYAAVEMYCEKIVPQVF
jgi:hypothetical protein